MKYDPHAYKTILAKTAAYLEGKMNVTVTENIVRKQYKFKKNK
jgi:hypothetical protein